MNHTQPTGTCAVRPKFEDMPDKALRAYVSASASYVSGEDPTSTRAERVAIANMVFDRKAEDFAAAKAVAAQLDEAVKATAAVLAQFPKGPLGLTPDDVKASDAFKAASSGFDKAFGALRAFNEKYTRVFAIELRSEREAVRAARLAALG